jgi:hypothetical protein
MPASKYVLDGELLSVNHYGTSLMFRSISPLSDLFDPRAIKHFKETVRNIDDYTSSSPDSSRHPDWSSESCDTTDQRARKRQKLEQNTSYEEEKEVGLSLTLVQDLDTEDEIGDDGRDFFESGASNYRNSGSALNILPDDLRGSPFTSRNVRFTIPGPPHANPTGDSREPKSHYQPMTCTAKPLHPHPRLSPRLKRPQDKQPELEQDEDHSGDGQHEAKFNALVSVPRNTQSEPKPNSKKSYFEANVIRLCELPQMETPPPAPLPAQALISKPRSSDSKLDLAVLDAKLEEVRWYVFFCWLFLF